MARISIFGEPLLEIAPSAPGVALGPVRLGVAGDTLNTAVYLARLGHSVSYVTALGCDAYSDAIIDLLHEEGVSTKSIARHPQRVAGLYAIRTDERGERYFTYWREQSAAREFFELADAADCIASALDCELFYFTGISLSILSARCQAKLLDVASACAKRGIEVGFDGNYRPRGWASAEAARAQLEAAGRIASIVLPTGEDDDLLYGRCEPLAHAKRWRSLGAATVVVKNGPHGAWVAQAEGEPLCVAVDEVIHPVDTTGAGDSFNAGFFAAMLDGQDAPAAVLAGHRLAGRVIQHRGALIARHQMP